MLESRMRGVVLMRHYTTAMTVQCCSSRRATPVHTAARQGWLATAVRDVRLLDLPVLNVESLARPGWDVTASPPSRYVAA